MFSKVLRPGRKTAAWRIAGWTTLAFSLGTAFVFAIIYVSVANSVRERTDAWLAGEAGVLLQVSNSTPRDALYDRVVMEIAELATHEVPNGHGPGGESAGTSAFFLQTGHEGEQALWVGPDLQDAFLRTIQGTTLALHTPQSLWIDGVSKPFRVVAKDREHGGMIYLGVSDASSMRLLGQLTRRFVFAWAVMVLLGLVISYASARGTLRRVEHISETVDRIGSDDLNTRLPQSVATDEITHLASTFNQMLDRIQASVNQLHTVTDSIAHDLKSPVTTVRGRLEAALSTDKEDSRELVADAIDALDRLLLLLDTILDLAEAEAGALHLNRQAIDLSTLLRQQIDLYQPALAAKNHTVSADIANDIFIDGDVSLINRVLSNLFENELAHLPDGGRIQAQLHASASRAELTIEDNGPGFPPDLHNQVFERFVKGKGSRGRGLGLAFVKAVTQAHGGVVKIGRTSDRGAKVFLSFPLMNA